MIKENTKQTEIVETKVEHSNMPYKTSYTIQENVITSLELGNDIIARHIEYNGKQYVDIRKFWRSYPTKKGIRGSMDAYSLLNKCLFKQNNNI